LINIFTRPLYGKLLVGVIGFMFLCFILFYEKLVIGYF
jgi:hypothetical protein